MKDFLINDFTINIFSGVVGVFITLLFMYIFERIKIKKDIEIKVGEDLRNMIVKCNSSLTTLDLDCFTLKTYNVFYGSFKKYEGNFGETDFANQNYNQIKSIEKELSAITKNFKCAMQDVINMIFCFEMNVIALNRFLDFYDMLIKKQKALMKNYKIFMNECNKLSYSLEYNPREITDEELEKLEKIENIVEIIKADMLAYLYDFSIEIQNEFYSKYFKMGNKILSYKIARRKPKKGKVISTKKYTKQYISLLK